MQSRIIIVHGWADNPTSGWMSWLAAELQRCGHEVVAPRFPSPPLDYIDISVLLTQLHQAVGELRPDDVFVGHSLGVALTLRTLLNFPETACIGGLVLVAGLADSSRRRPNALFDPPLDFARLTQMARRRIVIHSDNDHIVLPIQSKSSADCCRLRFELIRAKATSWGSRAWINYRASSTRSWIV